MVAARNIPHGSLAVDMDGATLAKTHERRRWKGVDVGQKAVSMTQLSLNLVS